jgi:signal transduction histidine kinase/ActR/RegA family two-component response regulator
MNGMKNWRDSRRWRTERRPPSLGRVNDSDQVNTPSPRRAAWPTGSSELAALVRHHDWSATPLGPIEQWPQSLRSVVQLVLESPLAMIVLWGDELIQIYNDGYRIVMAAKHPTGLGQPTRQCWPEVWRFNAPIYEAVFRGERRSFTDQRLRIERNGVPEDAWFDLTFSPVRDESSAIAGLLVTVVETTTKVLAQVRQSFRLNLERRLRPLRDSAAILSAASEELGRHLGANQVAYADIDEAGDLASVEREWNDGSLPSVAGRHRLQAFGTAFMEQLKRGETIVVSDVRADGRISSDETLAAFGRRSVGAFLDVPLVKNGRLVAILAVRHGIPRTWLAADVGLAEDVAESTWATVERARAEEALRAADARKDEFLAVLGHELRNPLGPLSTGLELLHTSDQRELVSTVSAMMQRQLSHLVRLVDDLLDLSRISRGTISLQRASLDLNGVVDEAVEFSKPQIAERGHELLVHHSEAPLRVDGDFQRLTQVLVNLVTNAAKYMEPGGRIWLSIAARDGEGIVRVRDAGYGIPPERLESVFDMFSQIPEHRAKIGGGGLGIGLALCRKIAALHGGALDASSEGFGRGSEFVLRLPLGTSAKEPEPAPRPAPPASPARRVLVVDDNVDAARALCMLLEVRGHDARLAYSAESALETAQRHMPDVVLLDIGLPGMDGYEVARRIRALPNGDDVLLVAVTGWGQEEDRLRSRQAGFDEHLTKPVDSEQLLMLIGRGRKKGSEPFSARY